LSSTPRYFITGEELAEGVTCQLSAEDSHHAHKVLRLKEGDKIEISDGEGSCYHAAINSATPAAVEAVLKEKCFEAPEPIKEVILVQGMLKGNKMDTIVHQAVELGVKRIIPLITQRSIPVLQKTKVHQKTERWQKIARAAASQSKRNCLPHVETPAKLEELISGLDFSREIIIAFGEEKKDKESFFLECRELLQNCEKIRVIIGPEGGFSAEEIEFMESHKVKITGMGPRILRAETAAVVGLTLVQNYLGDI